MQPDKLSCNCPDLINDSEDAVDPRPQKGETFEEVDLSEEWEDFDDCIGKPVIICDIEFQFVPVKQ